MVETALEREEAGEDLLELRWSTGDDEGTEGKKADAPYDEAELDDPVDLELCDGEMVRR